MNRLYPTPNNKTQPYGLPAYDIRGNKLYPTANNKTQPYGLPAYQIR